MVHLGPSDTDTVDRGKKEKRRINNYIHREIWMFRQMLSNAGQKIMSIISAIRGMRDRERELDFMRGQKQIKVNCKVSEQYVESN